MEQIRLIHFPDCKMVTSGAGMFGDENFTRFEALLKRESATSPYPQNFLTDAEGGFAFDNSALLPVVNGRLTFVDDDGEANGGLFRSTGMPVYFTQTKGPGRGSSWYEGAYEAPDVEVTLERVEEQSEAESD